MTVIQAVVVPCDEHEPIGTVNVQHDHMPDFERICGGPVDPMRVPPKFPEFGTDAAMIYCRVLGREHSPNMRATEYLGSNFGIYPNHFPYWLGNVVFVGVNELGYFLSCPVTLVSGLMTFKVTLTSPANLEPRASII